MSHYLEADERAEMDNGYLALDPEQAKCPAGFRIVLKDKEDGQRARTRQETLNKRFKNFQALQKSRHTLIKHAEMFRSVTVITQLNINNGDYLMKISQYGL